MAAKPKPESAALPYFRPDALKFLRNLARNNDREWFTPRKAVFEAELKEPMLAIIRKVNDGDGELCAGLCAAGGEVPLPHLSRHALQRRQKALQNARRRLVDRRRGWRRPPARATTSMSSAKEVVIAAGAWMPEKDQLAAIRHWLLDHHAEFRKLLQTAGDPQDISPSLKAMRSPARPKGFPCEHPALDLIRCRQWGLSTTLPAAAALEADFAADADSPLPAGRAGGGCAEYAHRAASRRARRCFSGWIEALRAAAYYAAGFRRAAMAD